MGAWSAGNFGNDDACDWLDELYKSGVKKFFKRTDASKFIEQTLSKVARAPDSEYLESSDCSEALAACEILAASLGNPASDLQDETKEWLEKHAIEGAKDLMPLAVGAVSRIRTNSELKELWEESDSNEEWQQVIEDLSKRMQAANA